jgi:hypothetical protein
MLCSRHVSSLHNRTRPLSGSCRASVLPLIRQHLIMILSNTALLLAPLAAVLLISTVSADGNDLALDFESTRFVKRRASPSWDEPYVPQTSDVPNSRSVPSCYGLDRPLKAYDEGGRGLELLGTMKAVKCKDDGECKNVFVSVLLPGKR